ECVGLENRYARKGIKGSNPFLSVYYLLLAKKNAGNKSFPFWTNAFLGFDHLKCSSYLANIA
ncbi:MAG TPA: hypothetical protein PLN21_10150, partial [Gemmatales bacterium]|nr:hypothetical protein [Gemmatales bacterium]